MQQPKTFCNALSQSLSQNDLPWVHPPPSDSHYQDYHFCCRGSKLNPFFCNWNPGPVDINVYPPTLYLVWLHRTLGTVDGKNPANQFRLVVYPIIYKALNSIFYTFTFVLNWCDSPPYNIMQHCTSLRCFAASTPVPPSFKKEGNDLTPLRPPSIAQRICCIRLCSIPAPRSGSHPFRMVGFYYQGYNHVMEKQTNLPYVFPIFKGSVEVYVLFLLLLYLMVRFHVLFFLRIKV